MIVVRFITSQFTTFATAIYVHSNISEIINNLKKTYIFRSHFWSRLTKFSLPLLLSQLETNQAATADVFFSFTLFARCLLASPKVFFIRNLFWHALESFLSRNKTSLKDPYKPYTWWNCPYGFGNLASSL